MKYRKKPAVIEAVRFKRDNLQEIKGLFGEIVIEIEIETPRGIDGVAKLSVKSPFGELKANEGDYIIKSHIGEIYPCQPDVFERTYELEVPS